MMFKHFDIHSHLNLDQFDSDCDAVIHRMEEDGVGTITVGVDIATSEKAVAIAERSANIFASIGTHPTDSKEPFDEGSYLQLLSHPKVVAIGECGLDYFRLSGRPEEITTEKNRQKELFEKHIALSVKTGKPLMIHARPSKGSMDAYADALDILAKCAKLSFAHFAQNGKLSANFHFFVGDVSIARRVLIAGYTMSFDGPITFARDYDDVIRMLPLESIMVETDAPFAAPAPYRGKRCEPWMVGEIVKKIAEIKELNVAVVAKAMVQNAGQFFNLPL